MQVRKESKKKKNAIHIKNNKLQRPKFSIYIYRVINDKEHTEKIQITLC